MFGLASLPLIWLIYAIYLEFQRPGSALGAEPGEAVVLHLGNWTLRLLLLTLGISTLRRLFRWHGLMRVRRMLGLYAFAYLCLHMLAYLGLLSGFDWGLVLDDFVERSYITAGLWAFLLLIPLAVTSTRGWQRRLGRNWKQVHQLIYFAVGLGLVHLVWLTKDGYGEVLVYIVLFALLMVERFIDATKRRN